MKFTITTFNLRLNVSSDQENAWPNRVNSVVKYIQDTNPFVFGTQEVLDGMLKDLKTRLPEYSYIGVTRKQNEEASAIFYKHDILEVKECGTFWLSETPEIPNSRDYDSACVRICTWGELMVKSNRTIRFRVFNTHLDHVSNVAKIEGMKTIVKRMNLKYNEEKLPTILMGDFNSTIEDDVVRYLKDGQSLIGNHPLVDAMNYIDQTNFGATFHGFKGLTDGLPIDHIFVTHHIKVHKTEIFREKLLNIYPSDHYPVTSLIELRVPIQNHCYHTHNERCGHAKGTIRDYVVEARKLGIKTIGFTDHVPFKDGRIPGLRMKYDLLEAYLKEIKEAKKTFNDIEILSGFECEYFHDLHDYYVELKSKVDYLILGQHYVNYQDSFVGNESFDSPELLISYCEHIEQALDTGLFTILAHPDSFGLSYQTFDQYAIEITHKIAQSAKKNKVILELNCNGFRRENQKYVNKFPYPLESVWKIIASDYPELPVVITADAHRIEYLSDEAIQRTYELAQNLNLKIVNKIILK